ncbi:NUAK family SNF1-like kinase 1 [Lytechinus variegatus]|uniref:NUAK family SNF1-like kinase 1 n=1 Tax=Lytechinus variegatus TaxID=7654 RepID=UPI001BB20DD6|nr:NUAK family SNF1-like kinase 1 [Lytechinus variegatus]
MTGDCPVKAAVEESNGNSLSNSPSNETPPTGPGTSADATPVAAATGVKHHRHRHKLKHRYRFEKTLGKGTYGKVKLATEISTGNQFAIKSIPKNKIEDPEDMRRIRQEIELMSTLDHPNIVNIYEVFESKEKIVIVMEYASGGELYEFIDSSSIPMGEIQRLFRQIVSALAYCHLNNIVHRDLKLENVLLDEDGDAKIADFGLSSYYSDNDLLHTFCGSPLYASPEIVNGQPYHGPEVDCWSLGVILYAMVYKTMPFGGDDFNNLKRQIIEGRYYDPCPGTVQSQLIRHLLSIDPRYRATIYDVAHHPWVFGEDANEILTMEFASSIGEQNTDSSKERESTESSDTESDNKPPIVAVKPTSILKASSKDSDSMVATERVNEQSILVEEQPKVSVSSNDSGSDSPSSPLELKAKGLPQVKGVIQNETDSFLSLASSTATLPSEASIAITNDDVFGRADVPVTDVVKRRAEPGKVVRAQRPATVGALYSDLPSPRTLVNQLIGEDTIFECSSEEKRASARLSKRISCGKYSKITELWESIFNESHLQAVISSKSPKSGSDESPGSSSSEDLLEILNSQHLKKSYSSSFKLTRHRFSNHRRSMRTHKEMVIMEAQQLQMRSESLFEKPEFRKGTRDSGLGDDLENLAKVYQKALEISSSVN